MKRNRYSDKLKGRIFQGAIQSLFEENNYKIVPFGVENTLREITHLNRKDYNKLNLPDAVKYTPDFMIFDKHISNYDLLEVKYRSNFKKELFDCIEKQVNLFGEMLTIVFLAKPPDSKYSSSRQASTHIRIIHAIETPNGVKFKNKYGELLSSKEILLNSFNWYNFSITQEIFDGFSSTGNTLETTTEIILNLLHEKVTI